MAEITADTPVPALTEAVDFLLEDQFPATDAANEDFDFDLGGAGEGNEDGQLDAQASDGLAVALTNIENATDVDEIGYEEEEGQGEPGKPAGAGNDTREEVAPEHDEGADEIDYEDVDLRDTNHDEAHGAGEAGDSNATEQNGPDEANDDIDFGFEETGDHAGEEEHDGIGHDDYDQEDDGAEGPDAEEHENDDVEVEDEDEDQDEEVDQSRADVDLHESDGTGQDYDEDDDDNDDDDDADSSAGSLDAGLNRLQDLYPVSPFDVVVTWGDQVCPLFKAPGVEDDPDSFYIEDYEAVDYSLSRFLQTIRKSISSWVHSSDEIYIRVDDLGLEFGETTTEALLGQVTFHNLLALHNTLVKNDNPDTSKGVHITLGTRPNCLLRLKDLVGGAGSGKGLSVFQTGRIDVDDSPDDGGEVAADSSNSSPGDDADDLAEDDEGSDASMAGSLDNDTAASGSAPQSTIEEGAELGAHAGELETPAADDDYAASAGVSEEVGIAEYATENGDENEEGVGGVLLATTGAVDVATLHEDTGGGVELAGDGGDLIQNMAADAAIVEQHDELDLLEDLDDAGNILSQTQDGQEGAHLEPANGLEAADPGNQQGDNDDDFLDLEGDIDTAALDSSKAAASELDVSLGTSATATLDHDEIGYEETRQDPNSEVTLDGGVDEIDWDDEIKNSAPNNEPYTPASASGKRTREADEADDGLLQDDLPDIKRQRADVSLA